MRHIEILGQNIKRRRKELGLTQRQLKALTGCTIIHKIEAGENKLTNLDNLRRIAEVLGLEMQELFMPPTEKIAAA